MPIYQWAREKADYLIKHSGSNNLATVEDLESQGYYRIREDGRYRGVYLMRKDDPPHNQEEEN